MDALWWLVLVFGLLASWQLWSLKSDTNDKLDRISSDLGAGLKQIEERLTIVGETVESVESAVVVNVEELVRAVEEVNSAVEGVKSAVEGVESAVEAVKRAVESVENTVQNAVRDTFGDDDM